MAQAQMTWMESRSRTLHTVGVVCGLAAGAWLGIAEAPVKLASGQVPPFVVTLGMVLGVFMARWTLPILLKGAGFVLRDLRQNAHLIVWALIAGTLWVVANTLTVYAIRNVGLSVAFPLWNTHCLIGLVWGWLFFNELKGSGWKGWAQVFGGSLALVIGAAFIGTAAAPATERHSWSDAMQRECQRYGLDESRVALRLSGDDPDTSQQPRRAWWELLIPLCSLVALFWLATLVRKPAIGLNATWIYVLVPVTCCSLAFNGWLLWKRTRFA